MRGYERAGAEGGPYPGPAGGTALGRQTATAQDPARGLHHATLDMPEAIARTSPGVGPDGRSARAVATRRAQSRPAADQGGTPTSAWSCRRAPPAPGRPEDTLIRGLVVRCVSHRLDPLDAHHLFLFVAHDRTVRTMA